MPDELKLPKTFSRRLEKIAAITRVNPESILKMALKDKFDCLEWKEKAIAEGQSDLDNGRGYVGQTVYGDSPTEAL